MIWSTIDLASPPAGVGKDSSEVITMLQAKLQVSSLRSSEELHAKLSRRLRWS